MSRPPTSSGPGPNRDPNRDPNTAPEDIIEAGLAAPPSTIVEPAAQANVAAAASQPAAPPNHSSGPQNAPQKVAGLTVDGFVQNRLAVIGVLFGVTGFLGLPLLWMNKKFSDGERWFWAISNTVYTCGLIYGAFRICMWSYRQVFP